MKKQIQCLIAAVLLFVLLAGCSLKERIDSTSGTGSMIDRADPNDAELTIYKTKYCNLKYPAKWLNQVKVETKVDIKDVYTVQFILNDNTPIFDLLFSGNTGPVLGTLIESEENIVIRIKNYTIDKNDSRYDDFCSMSEDVNVIIANLEKDYSFAIGQEIAKEDIATFAIKTNIVTLYYPIKWKEQVSIDISDQSIRFSCKEHKLFDILYGSSEGDLVGFYNGTIINIVSYDIDEAKVSDEIYRQLCAMQEDVNVILQHLMEDPAFKIAG